MRSLHNTKSNQHFRPFLGYVSFLFHTQQIFAMNLENSRTTTKQLNKFFNFFLDQVIFFIPYLLSIRHKQTSISTLELTADFTMKSKIVQPQYKSLMVQQIRQNMVIFPIFPVYTGRRLNVHMTFRKTSCVRSLYVLCLRSSPKGGKLSHLFLSPKMNGF